MAGSNPGILKGVWETESLADVTWAGAVAPGATIDLVLSASTNATAGFDLAMVYAVDHNLGPLLSASVEACELFLGNAGNTFIKSVWQQASLQGMTVLVAASDSGSAGCDNFDLPTPAKYGFAVNGYASTAYNVAVGGTDFNDLLNAASYWNPNNDSTTQASVLGYIPEVPWNESCASLEFMQFGYGPDAEVTCNNSIVPDYDSPLAGSGGKSSCTVRNGSLEPSNCTGGYPKPSAPAAPPRLRPLLPASWRWLISSRTRARVTPIPCFTSSPHVNPPHPVMLPSRYRVPASSTM